MYDMIRIPSKFFILAFCLCVLQGCIHNDLPYPRIEQYITSVAADGQIREADIDTVNFRATVYLDETVDIEAVKFTSFDVTAGASATPDLREGVYNMTSPVVVNVSLYQNYQWIVGAVQPIERYFTIAGQLGETAIDVVGRRIVVRVPASADLSRLELTSVKLGPRDVSVMSPALTPGTINLSRPLRVAVTAFGRTEDWTIYVEKSELLVQTVSVDAWSQVVWASGSCPAQMKGGFMYKTDSDSEWRRLEDSAVSQTGGSFSACIPHLTPLSSYVVRAVAEDADGTIWEGEELAVTTQATEVLPDASFDQWWLDNRVWCPWNEHGVRFWDTGNVGASKAGSSNVQPSDDTPLGSGQSAKLETRFVGLAPGLGKLAAGSIFTGAFQRVDGTNGILDFGRPWTVRPTRLRGYFKYKTAPINYTSGEYKMLEGRPDSCHIYVALTDWTAPYEIRTNPNTRQLFDADSPSVIAYGELVRGSDTDGWQEFEIRLNYRSTSRVPSYIQITCAASKYGDFFTGGAGAVLFVDDFSLLYDY